MRAFLTSAVSSKLRPVFLFAISLVLVASLVTLPAKAAGNAVMYFSEASGTFKKDDTVNVRVRVDTQDELVNAVQAVFTYPKDILEFERIDPAGSAFGIDAQSFVDNGSANIARGNIIPVKGDAMLATVQFKVIANNGKADLAFTDESSIVRVSDNTNILDEKRSASYTISTPGTEPEPEPTPTPDPTPTDDTPDTPVSNTDDVQGTTDQTPVVAEDTESENLPTTGPAGFAGAATAVSVLYYGAAQYLRSRRMFKSAVDEKVRNPFLNEE